MAPPKEEVNGSPADSRVDEVLKLIIAHTVRSQVRKTSLGLILGQTTNCLLGLSFYYCTEACKRSSERSVFFISAWFRGSTATTSKA